MNRPESLIAQLTRLDSELKTYKFGLATAGCIIFTLICVIIYLLG